MTRAWPLLLLTVGALAARFATAPTAPEAADSVYFLRGIERYAVVELRPHWPGYPVYIWCGRLARAICGDPVVGLHALSIVASTLVLWPLAALASAWRWRGGAGDTAGGLAGLAAALFFTLSPGSWVTGSQIFSDPLGLLLALTVLWLSWTPVAAERDGGWRLPAAAFVAGLLLGTRLVYGALLLPLVLATWWRRRERVGGRVRLPLAVLAAMLLGVVPWLTWQVSKEGARWIAAGAETLSGHFGSWGESAATDESPAARPLRLLWTTLVYGIGGWGPGLSAWRIPVTVAFVALAVAGVVRLAHARRAAIVAAAWILPYVVWMVLAQDVDYPRHALPVVALACVLAGMGLPARPLPAAAVALTAAASMAAVTVPIAIAQRRNPALEHQLAVYLARHAPPGTALILAADLRPALVFLREAAPGVAVEVAPLSGFGRRAAVLAQAGQAVYATAPAPERPQDWVVAARFCRDHVLDPRVARELWLFRLEPGASPEPLPACGFREAGYARRR